MVRDPVERVLSNYFFLRAYEGVVPNTDDVRIPLARKLSLGEFIEVDHPQVRVVVENHQTYFFAGDWRVNRLGSEEALKGALDHLDAFQLIGVQDRYHESLQALCALLGWTPWPAEVRLNGTPGRSRADEIPRQTLDRIRELNALDIHLVEEIRRRFDAQYRSVVKHLVAVNHRSQRRPLATAPEWLAVTFDRGLVGEGWHAREQDARGYYRLLGPAPSASVSLQIAANDEVVVEMEIADWTDPRSVSGLSLTVGDLECQRIVCDVKEKSAADRTAVLAWVVPLNSWRDSVPFLDLMFHVPPHIQAQAVGRIGRDDRRAFVAARAIRVGPKSTRCA